MKRVFQPELPFNSNYPTPHDVECDMAQNGKIRPSTDAPVHASQPAFSPSFTHSCEGSGILVGDSRQALKTFPDNYFQSCITSPPYWGLRDYDVVGQIGAEPDLDAYVDDLKAIFREVRRVLKQDGTFWLNIGDAYTSGNRTWRHTDKKNPARSMSYRPATPAGLKPKDLIGIPWRIAFALQADGWFLRSDIVWHKPNCQPESVKDRPTRSHEYVFLLTRSEDYLYDSEAVREASQVSKGEKRNRRSVWSINTEPFPDAHFATFPASLVEPMVFAGSKPGDFVLDPFLGSGTVGEVCLRHGRHFVGIELKPEFAQIALRRLGWEQQPYEHADSVPDPVTRTPDLALLPPPVSAEAAFQGRAQGDRRSR